MAVLAGRDHFVFVLVAESASQGLVLGRGGAEKAGDLLVARTAVR